MSLFTEATESRNQCARWGQIRRAKQPKVGPSQVSTPTRRFRYPATILDGWWGGTDRMVPTFILQSFDGVGVQLCPGSLKW
jgi:hypothetical protein